MQHSGRAIVPSAAMSVLALSWCDSISITCVGVFLSGFDLGGLWGRRCSVRGMRMVPVKGGDLGESRQDLPDGKNTRMLQGVFPVQAILMDVSYKSFF